MSALPVPTRRRLLLSLQALALAACALALGADPARAQQVRLYGEQDLPDPREVAAILGGASQPASPLPHKQPRMRSIRLLDDAAPVPAPASAVMAEAATVPAASPAVTALALPVQFRFDSADLLPEARAQLDALAQGIRLLPPERAVRIEGHTDAAGEEDYNERLSQRRAQSVRRYLVALHGIDPARLLAVGRGEYAPLPGTDPHAPQNRRVQFHGE